MTAKIYLCALLLSILASLLAVVAFNQLVNPYGISFVNIKIEGFNARTMVRTKHDRVVKLYDVLNTRPRTVILGTSRVKQGFDPAFLSSTAYAPVYNAGIDMASIAEYRRFLEAYARNNPPIKNVFLELFL